MYFNDHSPPHFHAKYSGNEALFDFSGTKIEGNLPNHATELVETWISLHRSELEQNWQRARNHQKLHSIEPLE